MTETYKVIFTGKLHEGFEPDQVVRNFCAQFKQSQDVAEKLLNRGKEVVLKTGLNQEQAERYRSALEKIGLQVRLEGKPEEDASMELALEPMEGVDPEATVVFDSHQMQAAREASQKARCPKCGSDRMENGVCQECGVVAEKYLAQQQQLANDEGKHESEWVAPPRVDRDSDNPDDMISPQSVPAGHGLSWLSNGWGHFMGNPLAWALATIIWLALIYLSRKFPSLGIIPLGDIVMNILSPVFAAGFLIGCRAQDEDEDFTVGHLFAGFSQRTGQLILVGAIFLGALILLMTLIMGSIMSLMGVEMVDIEDPRMMAVTMSPGLLIALLVSLLFVVPLFMAYMFAPALVVFDELGALEAMKVSFFACLNNILPFLVYGLLGMLLLLVGSIPLGLGLLIVLPMLIGGGYAAYMDIFYDTGIDD
jgi:uncharacterized membrane protein/ribosomal protein L32